MGIGVDAACRGDRGGERGSETSGGTVDAASPAPPSIMAAAAVATAAASADMEGWCADGGRREDGSGCCCGSCGGGGGGAGGCADATARADMANAGPPTSLGLAAHAMAGAAGAAVAAPLSRGSSLNRATRCAPPPGGVKKPRSVTRTNRRTVTCAPTRSTCQGWWAASPAAVVAARSVTSPSGSNGLAGDRACASRTTAGVDPASANARRRTRPGVSRAVSSRVAVASARARNEWVVHARGTRPPRGGSRPRAEAAPVPVASTMARTRPAEVLVVAGGAWREETRAGGVSDGKKGCSLLCTQNTASIAQKTYRHPVLRGRVLGRRRRRARRRARRACGRCGAARRARVTGGCNRLGGRRAGGALSVTR